ncbi:CLUMA_CG013335, isoform A [Clunio marinus]|uniref:CLUMA_CG013335, isoform A n=1 Tax=Clunio marinus TaxID=568069 RepID=A0A1J1III4_9DIPT|nr:CLUMA_CG013335, isoform A [Clunio marinus]
MSSRRPRRSRIYDSNYSIGENYYKSALDSLDAKYSRPSSFLVRHSEPPAVSPTRPRINFAADLDEDLEIARDRASDVIRHETVLDHHSGRKALALEGNFDNQVQKTLDRIQASKKLLNSIDLENGYDNNESASSSKIIKKRSVKVVSDISSSSAAQKTSNDLTKWSKSTDYNDSESFAAARARQSAARLQDIEQDMLERSERQFKREQRAANVKKLLADATSDFDTDDAIMNGIDKTGDKVIKISEIPEQQTQQNVSSNTSSDVEDHFVDQIYQIIEFYKQEDPVGLPLIPLKDPMNVDDIEQSISMTKLRMTKTKLSGITKFRITYIETQVKDLKAKCGILFEQLTLKGDYVLSSFMSRSKGPFTILLKNVVVEGNAAIGVERDGKLRTQEILMDIKFADMAMDFKNLGFLAAVFQSLANSASNVIFDSIKPTILRDAYDKIKQNIDDQLLNFIGDNQIPNSISPIDNAIAEARRQVRAKGFDPFKMEDYVYPGVIGMKIFNTWVYGISSFYRLGEMSLKMRNNNATITVAIGTQEISGSAKWEVSIAKGMITRAGNLRFTVQHIKVLFVVSQPLNLSKRLKINDLQLDIGNIQVRSDGLGTADYLVEFFINIIPNLLRYQIMDALEKPIMRKIQDFTDKIDMETLVKDKLEEYHKTGEIKINLNKLEL